MALWKQLTFFAWVMFAVLAFGQEPPLTSQPLILDRIIAVPGADGRIDHMTVDVKTGRVFAAVYGNDTVAVVDVHRSREIHTINRGLDEPQGVAFLPDLNRIVVTNSGDGSCQIFDGTTYAPLASVKFEDDADQIRYDPVKHLIYVGYGDGAIGTIDASTNKIVGESFELGAHPESFQLEVSGPRIFVNLASKNQIAVINRDTRKITKWNLTGAGTNFPMALDEKHRRLFVAARRPASLLVLDMDTGRQIAKLPGAADSDDMWYDATRKRIYVPGGEGLIYVYQQSDAEHYSLLAKVPSTIGARTSAYFGQVGKHNSMYLAVPDRANRGAELWIYETRD
jgi:DNA-binding beta-propeller fold protein YncE